MDLVAFLKTIASVTSPLTLIAFIVVALLAALLLVLKSTQGLQKAQELLLKDAPLRPGEFRKIVIAVLLVLVLIAAIAVLNELRTRCILMQLREIKFLVIGKELKQPFDDRKRFAEMPTFSQKILGL